MTDRSSDRVSDDLPYYDPQATQQGRASTYNQHDCYAWNTIHWCNQEECQFAKCGYRGAIIGFRWRSWSKRIRSLFMHEPDHTSVSHD